MPGKGAARRSVRVRKKKTPYTGDTIQQRGPRDEQDTQSNEQNTPDSGDSAFVLHERPEGNEEAQRGNPSGTENASQDADTMETQSTRSSGVDPSDILLQGFKEIVKAQKIQSDSIQALIKSNQDIVQIIPKLINNTNSSSPSLAGPSTSQPSDQPRPSPSAGQPNLTSPMEQAAPSVLTGQLGRSSLSEQPDPILLSLIAEPIYSNVNSKVMEQIKKREYIKFRSMFNKSESSDSEDTDLEEDEEHLEPVSTKGSFVKMKKKKAIKKRLSWYQWDKAWQEFSFLHRKYHKELEEEMMFHLKNVQEIHESRGRWQFYDRTVRKLLAKYPSLKWNHPFQKIWMKSMMEPEKAMVNPNKRFKKDVGRGKSSNNFRVPQGSCFKFHRPGSSCRLMEKCKWKHQCFKCLKGNHPAFRCNNFRSRNPQPGSSSSYPSNSKQQH